MRNDIRLFINGEEIEFSADPKILLNYKEKELHNPTILRNSFSKQITVPGTPRNNDVFGHIWELTRIQDGPFFNPIKKTDFQLFVNDELFQKGYCKLDQVTRTNNTQEYKFTLYGGLGSFFYNLTYDQDDSGNQKKTLASLKYAINGGSEPELDFDITKESVNDAWDQVCDGENRNARWDVINFVPALNGIPNDFDAAKVLINNNGLNSGTYSGFYTARTVDGVTYMPTINGTLNGNGWSMGEAQQDLQEWQTRDLRSYNQRPCINMRRIIQACCNPENNGGYQVKLDSHFFHNDNPYYNSAWVTLPLLKDLDGVGGGETYTITGAQIATSSTRYMRAVTFNSPLATLNNVNMNVSVRFTPTGGTTPGTNLYPYRKFYAKGVTTAQNYEWIKEYQSNCGVMLQMFAYGRNGEIVGQSKAYFLGDYKFFPNYTDPMWRGFYDENGDVGVEPEYVFVQGYWKKINGNYVFVDPYGNPTDIKFSFSAPTDFTSLVLKVKQPHGELEKYFGPFWSEGVSSHQIPDSSVVPLYISRERTENGRYTLGQAMQLDRVLGEWNFVVTSMEGIATDYEGMFSGTKISKERLLAGEYSPADYLISYSKLFGLYFYYDSTEEADDTTLYPSGVVHIMDRDTFYTDEVMDLSALIDWNKKVDIVPALASSKWYRFDTEHVDSELETGYKEQFGKTYGSQTVNTNYNFDNNTTDLYDGNIFKSAIMCLEKDKYYKKSPAGLPVYQYNGFTYTLYHRNATENEFETYDIDFPSTTTMRMYSLNPDYEFYDAFPKLQFHGEDNTPVDGSNVLVFFKGRVDVSADYWLTDDVNEMITLNDATPCWIMTKSAYDGAGTEIAKKVERFPYFTRDLIVAGTYGNIVHSWNFGHPQIIYMPDTYTTEGDSIYDVCWKNYIHDLYSVDTRKLTAYVIPRMDDKPWPYWLRRFYWFENCIWALNEIKDLNVGSFDTCKMEFIKVQDVDNYKLDRIEYNGSNSVRITESTVDCTGGTVHGVVTMQTADSWAARDYIVGVNGVGNMIYLESAQVMHPSTGNGSTATSFTITVPANSGETDITWTVQVRDSQDVTYSATFVQEACEVVSTLAIQPTSGVVFSPSGSTSAFSITYNRVSGITVSSNAAWATPSLNGNQLTITYTKNNTVAARYATITVSGTGQQGPISATARLAQDGIGGITAPQLVELDYFDDSSATFQVTTNDDWTSTITDNE